MQTTAWNKKLLQVKQGQKQLISRRTAEISMTWSAAQAARTGSSATAGRNRNGKHKCTPKAQPAIQSTGRQQRGGTINVGAHKPTVGSLTTTFCFTSQWGGQRKASSGRGPDSLCGTWHYSCGRVHMLNSGCA